MIPEIEQQRKRFGKVIIAIMAIALLWCVYGATLDANAQAPTPTPVGMTCITPTPTGDSWCLIPPVAVTVTPSVTIAPPTVQPTLTLFVPTSTATFTVTPTNTPRPRPTIGLTPIRVGSNAHLPIIFK